MKSRSFAVAQVLFTKAGHDLQAAELLMAEGATDVICFTCHLLSWGSRLSIQASSTEME